MTSNNVAGEPRFSTNELVRKVVEYLPEEKMQFRRSEGGLQIAFVDRGALMTILESNTWDEIKRILDVKTSPLKDDTCPVCLEDTLHIQRVTCNKCANAWCVHCYIGIFRSNKGLMVCPYCRYSFGVEVHDEDIIELGVLEILLTAKLIDKKEFIQKSNNIHSSRST